MGNTAFADQLASVDELAELYELNASQTEPGNGQEDDEEEHGGLEPEDMPHAEPGDMPHVEPEDMPHAEPGDMPHVEPEDMPH
jgi:hypothetical protein